MLLLCSCVTVKKRPLVAPITVPPPVYNTVGLGNNIKDLDHQLDKVSSQIERLKILVNSIPEN
jgi:hypothetical protein